MRLFYVASLPSEFPLVSGMYKQARIQDIFSFLFLVCHIKIRLAFCLTLGKYSSY